MTLIFYPGDARISEVTPSDHVWRWSTQHPAHNGMVQNVVENSWIC